MGKGQSLEIKVFKSTDKLKYPKNQLILTYCFSLIGVPVNSRVSTKIQQLLNTLKRPKRPPLKEFFVDDSEEIVEGSSNSTKNIHSVNSFTQLHRSGTVGFKDEQGKALFLVERVQSSPFFFPEDHFYFRSQMKDKEGGGERERKAKR